ncbi:MAG: hypothetical protein GKR91_05335 [Pseudomonadales bacterium]|nr:hypothetical protein [Pseudomonadales bacterium]
MFTPISIQTPPPAMRSGLNGIHKASDAMNKASLNIVQKTFEDGHTNGLIEDFVELKKNQTLFNASGKVIQIANRTSGSLIDILA